MKHLWIIVKNPFALYMFFFFCQTLELIAVVDGPVTYRMVSACHKRLTLKKQGLMLETHSTEPVVFLSLSEAQSYVFGKRVHPHVQSSMEHLGILC